MSEIAIRAEGLGKQYRIGKLERYRTLRDSLTETVTAPFRRAREMVRSMSGGSGGGAKAESPSETIWALKDVSFEVPRGAVVGVIGRNGAGKSTLLKILSRITEPTEGHVEIRGRVGSLLEVGTGFHTELSGRENIYLNAAILGMRKAEIVRKFDEIVAFAEVEKFIDTPVKHYSSGMYMRLAFAVAAHMEPEILIVDEVLAVGDTRFQKKCLGKMGAVAKDGRTVIFVSHQMNQIRRLCGDCIWLSDGAVEVAGPTPAVVNRYEGTSLRGNSSDNSRSKRSTSLFTKWEVINVGELDSNVLGDSGPASIKFTLDLPRALSSCFHGIALYNSNNQLIWGNGVSHIDIPAGECEFHYRLDAVPLQPGLYHWLVTIYDEGGLVDQWECTPELVVGTEPLNHARDEWTGILNIPWTFSIQKIKEEPHVGSVEPVAADIGSVVG